METLRGGDAAADRGAASSLGVVAVHDPGGLSQQHGLGGPFEAYRALAAAGELGLRAHPCIRPEQLDAAEREGIRSGSPLGPDPLDRLRLGWLKTFADGSLGSAGPPHCSSRSSVARASRSRRTAAMASG